MPTRKILPEITDDDDTQGQFMPNPVLNRQLAMAREEEIQRNLKRREKILAARSRAADPVAGRRGFGGKRPAFPRPLSVDRLLLRLRAGQ
jgi:hypothetical protein